MRYDLIHMKHINKREKNLPKLQTNMLQLKPWFRRLLSNIQPGNGAGLFLQPAEPRGVYDISKIAFLLLLI